MPGVGHLPYQHRRRRLHLGRGVCWRCQWVELEAALGLTDGTCVELGIAEAASQSRPVTLPALTGSRLGAEGWHTEELGVAEATPSHIL